MARRHQREAEKTAALRRLVGIVDVICADHPAQGLSCGEQGAARHSAMGRQRLRNGVRTAPGEVDAVVPCTPPAVSSARHRVRLKEPPDEN